MIRLRPATAADAAGIAQVHVATWRTTYAGIVPEAHLAGLSAAHRAAFWGKHLPSLPPKEHVIVAVDAAERIVGFVSGGANRAPEYPYDGEVMAIYLLEEQQGQGTGRRLLQAAMDRLAADGFKSMMLWVLADNRTCGFYGHMGGTVAGEKLETIGGKALKELAVAWDSIPSPPSGSRIYHVAERQAWEEALPSGAYRHPSLASEGFIHCSLAEQVAGVMQRYFRGRTGLLLLEIVEPRIVAPVKYENAFPHIYGALNCDAVVTTRPVEGPAS